MIRFVIPEIIGKRIILTAEARSLTIKEIIDINCPYIVTMILVLQNKRGPLMIEKFWKKYMSRSIGNASFIGLVVKNGIELGLFEFYCK